MKLQSMIAVLSLALAAHATPVASNASPQKLKVYDIRWCKKKDYSGCGTSYELDVEKCYDLGSSYNNKAESVQHDKGVACYYYNEKDCKGHYLHAAGDHSQLSDEWRDVISSFMCYDEDGE